MENHGLFRVRPRSQSVPPAWVIGTILLGILAALAPLLFASGPATAKVSAAVTYVPQTRTYYIAADEVEWNYAPTRQKPDHRQAVRRRAAIFVKQGPDGSARTYIKSLYREYTDASSRHLKPRPAEAAPRLPGPGDPRRGRRHDQGGLQEQPGPFAASVHPHGVLLRQEQRGAPVRRRHDRRGQGRRRRAARRHPHLHLAGARAGRARARWTAAR